jgi:hypothetical protein
MSAENAPLRPQTEGDQSGNVDVRLNLVQENVAKILKTNKLIIGALGVSTLMVGGALVLSAMTFASLSHSHVIPFQGCTDTQCSGTTMFRDHRCEYAWCESGLRCHLENCSK